MPPGKGGREPLRMADLKRFMPRPRLRVGHMDAAARVICDVQVWLDNVEVRLGAVEERVRPGAAITDMQATEVSSQVKVLAGLLTGKDASKNHYQAFFAELYRRFGVSSSKLISQSRHQAVLAFLDDWRTSASSSSSRVMMYVTGRPVFLTLRALHVLNAYVPLPKTVLFFRLAMASLDESAEDNWRWTARECSRCGRIADEQGADLPPRPGTHFHGS